MYKEIFLNESKQKASSKLFLLKLYYLSRRFRPVQMPTSNLLITIIMITTTQFASAIFVVVVLVSEVNEEGVFGK